MIFSDLNFSMMLFLLVLTSICLNMTNTLHLLLTAELLWITLYLLTLSIGLLFDNVNMISLTFFFLILSAVEFGVGLVITLIQHIFTRSISLENVGVNKLKLTFRFQNKINHSTSRIL